MVFRVLRARNGDGGFMLACISGCRGVIGFNVARGRVLCAKKFALLGLMVGASAKKFALLGLMVGASAKKFALRLCFSTQARKSSPCALKTPHIRRFCACGASFFAEVPV